MSNKTAPTKEDEDMAKRILSAIENNQSVQLTKEEGLKRSAEFTKRGARVIIICSNCMKLEDRSKFTYPKCGSCKTVYYCNKNCQKLDWSRHKPFCLAGGEGYFESGQYVTL